MSEENATPVEPTTKVEAPATEAPATAPVVEQAAPVEVEPTKVDEMVASIGEPIAPVLTFKGEGQAGNAMDTMHGKVNDTTPRFAQ